MMSMTARQIAADVQSGRTTALAVAAAALDQVSRVEPGVNAFAHLDPELTLAEARDVDARCASEGPLPLAGVPIVIKDNIWVAGRPVTQGSRLFEGNVPPQDAVAVARLRRAGAVILGIGTCSEFACKGITNTPLHGITRNPFDSSRTPGGSSGGPAAAVASGMAPLALGTDAGGSSRRPPAHTGIVGLKPSQDVIPYGPGYPEPFWNTSVLAPIAADVADAALLFDVLADGPVAHMLEPAPADPKTLRIALAPTLGLDVAMDDSAWAALMAGSEVLREASFDIVEAAPAWPRGIDAAATMPLQWAGLAAIHGAAWRADPEAFDPDLGAQIEAGLALDGVAVARALDASCSIRDVLRGFLTEYDLILSATTPCPAWPVERLSPETIGGAAAGPRDHAALTPQFNHAGLPALSLPCGNDESGLPLGAQIGAGAGRDRWVLAAAAAFETHFRGAGLTRSVAASLKGQ